MNIDLIQLLSGAVSQGASDLHLTAEAAPLIRLNGELIPLMENPLDAAVQRIEANPAFAQHRLLTRLLAALPGQQGMFRTEEASVFDRDTLAVIVSLMHAHDTGASPPADWQRAINRVETAQMAHG